MEWKGPTWGQWADARDEAQAHINAHAESAQKWKAYAEELERQLKAMTKDRDDLLELYQDARGNVHGQKRLKEIALEEIAKLDPDHPFLNPENRAQPFDDAKEAVIKAMKAPSSTPSLG